MKRHLFYGIIFLLASGLMLTTCNKESFELNRLSDEIELQPSLVAPLIYGSMTVADIVEMVDSAGYVNEFDDGLIYLAYLDTFVDVQADELIVIPDKFYKELYIDADTDIPVWLPVNVGDTAYFPRTDTIVYELEGDDRLDSVQVKNGTLEIIVESSFKHSGYLILSSNQILNKERRPFSTTIEITNPGPGGTFRTTVSFDSDNYWIKPFAHGDSNVIQIDYYLALINSGSPISPGEQCLIMTNFLNMEFYKIFGYIDSRNLITESGSVEIPIYADNPELASLIFDDPRIDIWIYNSVGIPMEVEMDSVFATPSAGGTSVELVIDPGLHPFKIRAPEIDSMGFRVISEFNINQNTSNFDKLLEVAPSDLSYKVTGRTVEGESEREYFVEDTSGFRMVSEFLLPLDFKSSGFALKDTIDFEVGEDGVDTTILKEARISVTTLNELPIELELQVYLLDLNHTVIDSVFDGDAVILGASLVDDQGILTQAVEETTVVTFPLEKLDKLQEVYYMQVEARMITSELGGQFVKLYSDYSLDFKLSMYANLRINTRELN